MAQIGCCGLGRMGFPMASRLVQAGHEVSVWNRSKEKAEPLAERGAHVAATPREVAEGGDVVFTMLADVPAVKDVVLGADGLAQGMRDGATLVEMSTIGPDAVRELREALPAEVELVDAPVLGSVPQAENGELKIFVGGSEETFERIRDLFEVLGMPRLIGGLGDGA